jgi:hypothetical protein
MEQELKLSIAELKNIPETLLYPLKSRHVETIKKIAICALPEFFIERFENLY